MTKSAETLSFGPCDELMVLISPGIKRKVEDVNSFNDKMLKNFKLNLCKYIFSDMSMSLKETDQRSAMKGHKKANSLIMRGFGSLVTFGYFH